ncbi:MAG: SurA N-terminal domain-containing protein [Myxococcota bacterium]
MKRRIGAALLVATLLSVGLGPRVAEAVVVERVVAVVAEKAILLTDVRKRARPYLRRLYAQVPPGSPQRAGAESKIMKDMLEKMVDEELEQLVALRQNTTVTAAEVDAALRRVSRANNVPLSQLYEDVRRNSGMGEVEYRQEIRRQVLEGKLLNRFAQGLRVNKAEAMKMFADIRARERKILLYQPSWIVFRLAKDAAPEVVAGRRALARQVVADARAGVPFAELAANFSEDAATSQAGGDLGVRIPSLSPRAATGKFKLLAKELEDEALALDRGEVSDPFVFKEALVILTVTQRQPSRYVSFEAVKREMAERVRAEKLQRVKEKWLQDLRKRTFVDVRM